MRRNGIRTAVCREETIASVYKLVYETEDGRIRIYETCKIKKLIMMIIPAAVLVALFSISAAGRCMDFLDLVSFGTGAGSGSYAIDRKTVSTF